MASEAEVDKEILSYEEFGVGIRELAQQIADSGFVPDWIVAIARGGLVVGGPIAYALGLKNTAVINVEYYTDIDVRKDAPVVLPPVLDLIELKNTKVLVVDDVEDTGHTLELVLDVIRPTVAELRSAVLYHKPRSVVKSEFVWRETDRWIEFPWSIDPPVQASTRPSAPKSS